MTVLQRAATVLRSTVTAPCCVLPTLGGSTHARSDTPQKHPRPCCIQETPMKLYRRHYCEKTHRTYRTTAKCLWPRACWIAGEGPYASLAHCRVLTVELHSTAEAAEAAKRVIDSSGCGGACRGAAGHELIQIAV